MQRTGSANLPLHYGKAPRYLTFRMQNLARELAAILIDEYGSETFLQRISDPFWFQALGCALGYDWHSSGVTTVLTGVLKRALSPEQHGVAVCGGKGKASRNTPAEIEDVCEVFGLSDETVEKLRYSSKMSAKVDNAAVQAGYQLYHHAFFIAENGKWAVVQQGMCTEDRTARRYHWLSCRVESFVVEPHAAIIGDVRRQSALDMTARESEACRKASVDIVREKTGRLMRMTLNTRSTLQKSIDDWLPQDPHGCAGHRNLEFLTMPRNINWKTLERLYEFQPKNYEEMLGFKGVGPSTVRGLALIAELIYGEKPSWKDPVKYSFAYGGKDGVPHPVERKAMDESVQILRQAVQQARIGDRERITSLQKLRQFVPRE